MSQADIDLVKRGFERFLAGDVPGFVELVSDDVQWDHSGPAGVPFNRLYEGRAGVVDFFKAVSRRV